MRFLKRVLTVLFAIAAVLAGFVVAMVAGLLALVFFPLKRPVALSRPARSAPGAGGVIDVEATEISRGSGDRLRNP